MMHNGLHDKHIVNHRSHTKQIVLAVDETLVEPMMPATRIFVHAGFDDFQQQRPRSYYGQSCVPWHGQ